MLRRFTSTVALLTLAGAVSGTALAAFRGGADDVASPAGGEAGSARPRELARSCQPGFIHAVVAGKHRCLRRGQRCSRRHDRQYHRYGFHCHTGRLTGGRREPPNPPPPPAHRVVAGEGAFWVPWDDAVLRLDRATATVERIALRCPGSREAALGYGSLWLACKDAGSVLRIDVATKQIVATIATGAGAHHLAIGAGAVWVTNYQENSVSRIDPASNTAVHKITGAGAGVGLTVANGLVWAAANDGIAKIDPATNTITGRLRLGSARFYYGLVFSDGSLWASATALRRVYRLDPVASAGR